jgi:intracellular septation protein A
MVLPFGPEQFFAAFERYNLAVWPMQVVLLSLAIVVWLWVVRRRGNDGRWISLTLALLWAWMAMAYHFAFFAAINPAAWLFGAVFLLCAGTLAWVGGVRQRLEFAPRSDARGWLGMALVVFALLVYPALGWLLGHRYPRAPTFGLPCPTTIYTIGVLMFVRGPVPRSVLAVPLAWAVVGSTAAFNLGVYQDLGLLVAGAVALAAATHRGAFGTGAPAWK